MRIAGVVSCCIFLILYSVTSLFCSKAVFLSLKFLASVSFFLIAYFSRKRVLGLQGKDNARYRKFSLLFLWGFVFSVTGDTLIEIYFVPGFAAFFVAQIFFLIAFFSAKKPAPYVIPLTILITAALGVFEKLQPFISLGELFIPLMIYILVLMLNVVLSSQYLCKKNVYSTLMFIGLLIFFVSDFELQFASFGHYEPGLHRFFSLLNNFIYYPGQILLAYSLGKDFIS